MLLTMPAEMIAGIEDEGRGGDADVDETLTIL